MAAPTDKLQQYHDVALKSVKKCGPILLEGFQKVSLEFTTKRDFNDIVTIYDRKIEDILIEDLSKEFPETNFIGEENTDASGVKIILTDAPTWIIDPIDGTNNYVHKIPHCGISVGLAINKELVVGVVYNPILNELYTAYKGNGAYLNGQPIQTNKCEKMRESIIAHEISLIFRGCHDKYIKRLYKLSINCNGTRAFGSAAMSLCYVASGVLDVYHIEDIKVWDVAGATVILLEAGGVIFHSKGGNFDYMKPDLLAAATTPLAQEAIKLINEADEMKEYTFV